MSLFDPYNWQGHQGFPYHSGFYWLGPTNNVIPPTAPGLTDTVTGVVYYLLLNSAETAVILTTTPPPFPHKILPASDYLFLGQNGLGIKITNAALVFHVFRGSGSGGPPVFAPTTFVGIPVAVGGLAGYVPANGVPVITLTIACIVPYHTPTEPAQIAQTVAYNGYYYQVQDNQVALNVQPCGTQIPGQSLFILGSSTLGGGNVLG
jgi:hypothetical protein